MKSDIQLAINSGLNYVVNKATYILDQPLSKPTQVTISVTDACAARCTMCDIWQLQVKDELTASDWQTTLGHLRDWLGPFWLIITGGEPFQKRGIFDILSFCRDHQIKAKISSNGMYLKPKYCDKILETQVDFLSLSVDSIFPEIHDRIRGTVGLHESCMKAYTYLRRKSKRIVLGMATVIMEDNYRHLPDQVRWATEHGIDRVLFQPVQPNFASQSGQDWYKNSPHWVKDPDRLADVIAELLDMKANGAPIWNSATQLEVIKAYFEDPFNHPRPDECMVRYNVLNIDPHGNVNFCWTVNDTVGNVLKEHPADIWTSVMAREVRNLMKPCRKPCTLNCYRSRSLAEQIATFRFFWEREGISAESA